MPPVVSVQRLSVQFRQDQQLYPALQDLSFCIDRGEMVALVGESGSGKSVTALSILQLHDSATCLIDGKIIFGEEATNLVSCSPQKIRQFRGKRIGMIFQEPMSSLNPLMKCGLQITEALQVHHKISFREAKAKTIELLNEVNLPQPQLLFNRYPHQLSGGQKQRVMIAMAISCNPELLIADEPTTALDVTVQRGILELLQNLRLKRNMSVLLITHDLALVEAYANRVLILRNGKMIDQLTGPEPFKNATHPYTVSLLRSRPSLYTKGERIDTSKETTNTQNAIEALSALPTQKNNTAPPLITVKDLVVRFPVQKNWLGKPEDYKNVVNGVSFSVGKGEIIGLVGESGCGKTTLGRTMLQLLPAYSGEIQLEGKPLPTSRKIFSKLIQMVFQDPYASLHPRITIQQCLDEVIAHHHTAISKEQRRETAIALMKQVQLNPDHLSRYPHQFSGGQRQRIVIARALAVKPAFIVFDECVSALDLSIQAGILNLINDLKTEHGFAGLFISHDLSAVKYISDHVLVMKDGRIVETGDPERIWKDPQHPYTQRLLEAVPGSNFHSNIR